MKNRSLTDGLLLAGFCGFLFFFGLAYFGLVGADEPRYAQVAREMLGRHDWITPILGGKPWLEKPVLYYWQAMIAFAVFGVSDWAARLPSAIDATLMVVAVYCFLRRFRPGSELDGALMTAAAVGVIGFARAASTDMPLAAAFTIGLLGWYAWYESERKIYLAGFYVLLGLATLAKGPVAPFLAAAIILSFAALRGEMRLPPRTLWIPGIVLFCAVTLPWYVAVQIRNPEFFRVFILEHNLSRFGTDRYHHTQPFWYFLPVVLLGLAPWILFVLAALGESIRAWWREKRSMLSSERAFQVFLVVWLLLPVLFFSLSKSKLPGYILPALPGGTLLLADYVRRHGERRPNVILAMGHAVVAAVPVVPAVLVPYVLAAHDLPWDRATLIFGLIATALAAGTVITLRLKPGLRMLRFVTLVPVVLAVGSVLRFGAPALDAHLSARPLANEITRTDNGTLPLAVFRVSRETEYGLHFYRNQAIARYESGEVPSGEHMLVAPQGTQAGIARRLPGRRVSFLGTSAEQKLDYYWVSPPGTVHPMQP
jgi:4-amino-4-deoxy-L-arabinose transferase-like glycosyltransferase